MVRQEDVGTGLRKPELTYETVPLGWIKPAKRNARKHSAAQIDEIAGSIATSGPINPLIVDQNYRLIAGEGRWRALQKPDATEVQVLVVRHLTEAETRAYAIADNRIFVAQLLRADRVQQVTADPPFNRSGARP